MTTNLLPKAQKLRKFRIKHKRYVNYRVALVGEITTRFFLIQLKKASCLTPNSHNV